MAVRTWTEHRDMERVEMRQQEILLSYERDISRHAESKSIAKIWNVWQSIPGQLARENKKFVYSLIRKGARAKEYEDAIRWIAQAGTIHLVTRVEKPGLPLAGYEAPHDFKIYYGDVGLLRKKAELERTVLMGDGAIFREFKGALAENFVLQELAEQFRTIHYWSSAATAEVDFIVQNGGQVLPIEVKSGDNVKAKSLRLFMTKYGVKKGIRFSRKNVDTRGDIVNLPIFMAGQLKRVLA
jgi:predicted AAA+ superfamily ATPase